MPVTVERTNDNGIIVKATGETTAEELLLANSDIYDDFAAIRWIKYQIIDLSEVTTGHFTLEEIEYMAEQDVVASNVNSKMLITIVATKELYKSITKVWQKFIEIGELETKLFDNRIDAEQWIQDKLKEDQ